MNAHPGSFEVPASVGIAPGHATGINAGETLFLMQCGQAKVETDRPVPLFELYNGPLWQDLRRRLPERVMGNVFVMSGLHGFRSAWLHSKPYDAKISTERVDALIARGFAGHERSKSGAVLGTSPYAELAASGQRVSVPFRQVVAYGSGEYRRAFGQIIDWASTEGFITAGGPVVWMEGSILAQRRQFNEVLRTMEEYRA